MTQKELDDRARALLDPSGDYSGIETGITGLDRLEVQIAAADRRAFTERGSVDVGGEAVLSGIVFSAPNSIEANDLRNRN